MTPLTQTIEPFMIQAKVLRPGMSLPPKSQPTPPPAYTISETIDWIVLLVEFFVVAPFTACSLPLLLLATVFAFSGFDGPAGLSLAAIEGMCLMLAIVVSGACGLAGLWMLLMLSPEYLAQHSTERRFAVAGVCSGIALAMFFLFLCQLVRDTRFALLGAALIGIALHRLWRVSEVMGWFKLGRSR